MGAERGRVVLRGGVLGAAYRVQLIHVLEAQASLLVRRDVRRPLAVSLRAVCAYGLRSPQEEGRGADGGDQVLRTKYTPEEKIRIVLEGFRREHRAISPSCSHPTAPLAFVPELVGLSAKMAHSGTRLKAPSPAMKAHDGGLDASAEAECRQCRRGAHHSSSSPPSAASGLADMPPCFRM